MLEIKTKTSLGINISEGRVSAALVRQSKDGLKLLNAGCGDIPQGAIVNGNIADSHAVAKVIRNVLDQAGIKKRSATVSLVARPVLTQVIDLPDEMPGNLGQYVQTETKHSAVLAGKEPHYDFCGLGNAGPDAMERVFVAATDNEKISVLMRTMALAHIEVDSIDLGALGCVNGLYDEKISTKFSSNVLVAFIQDSVIVICVFRKTALDFVRCIDASGDVQDKDKYLLRLQNEISAVKQFYDIEVEYSSDEEWEFIVANEDTSFSVEDVEFYLQKYFGSRVYVSSSATVYSDTPLIDNESIEQASITAVGLAMKPFKNSGLNVSIDLIPEEAEEVKATKKLILVTANVAAVILLGMCLTAGYIRYKLGKVEQQTAVNTKQQVPAADIEELLARQRLLNYQIDYLSAKKERMKEVCDDYNVGQWADILTDISRRMPTSLCVGQLRGSSTTDSLVLEGNALSYKSIHMFAELLDQSDIIVAATVAETNKNAYTEGLITYTINCNLSGEEEVKTDGSE